MRMKRIRKSVISWILMLAMVLGVMPDMAIVSAAEQVVPQEEFWLDRSDITGPYGVDMSSTEITLVAEAEDALSYQWQVADSQNGEYVNIDAATEESYTFTPVHGKWYRCKVNGVTTNAVKAIKAGEGEEIFLNQGNIESGQWYLTNGEMAYAMLNKGEFDVVGRYTYNDTDYWMNTTNEGGWQIGSVQEESPSSSSSYQNENLGKLRLLFDKYNRRVVNVSAELAEGYHSVAVGAEIKLGDSTVTNNSSSAIIRSVIENDEFVQMQAVTAESLKDATDDDCAVIFRNSTAATQFWVGNIMQSSKGQAYSCNSGHRNYNNNYEFSQFKGDKYVSGTDLITPATVVSWTGLAEGSEVEFSVSAGNVKQLGAKTSFVRNADSITVLDADIECYYSLCDRETGDTVCGWVEPDGNGQVIFAGLASGTDYILKEIYMEDYDESAPEQDEGYVYSYYTSTVLDPYYNEKGFTPDIKVYSKHIDMTGMNPEYEYALRDEYGQLVVDYKNPDEDGNLVFEGLKSGTLYSVHARTAKVASSEPISLKTLYAVYFDMHGFCEEYIEYDVEADSVVACPATPESTRGQFIGWYKDAAYTEEWNFETDTITENTIIYSKWEGHEHTWVITGTSGTASAHIECTTENSKCSYYGAENDVELLADDVDYTGGAYAGAGLTQSFVEEYMDDISVYYEGVNDTVYAKSLNPPTEVGTYVASVTVADSIGVDFVFKKQFEIRKIDPVYNVPTAQGRLEYTGKEQTLVSKETVEGGIMYYSLDNDSWSQNPPKATELGNYNVYYKVTGDANHNDIEPQCIPVTINAVSYEGEYDAQPHTITVNAADGATVKYSATEDGEYETTPIEYVNAGEYEIFYIIEQEEKSDITGSAYVNISKKDITVKANDANKVYGEDDPAEYTYEIIEGELIEDESLTLNIGRLAGEDAGEYAIVITENNNANPNYNVRCNSGKFTISQKEVVIEWAAVTTFEYNGETQAPAAEVANLVGEDECEVIVSGGQVNAGEYTAVASGLSNANYKLPVSGVTCDYEITRAQVAAPDLTGIDETIKGKADGRIEGLTTAMEYRVQGGDKYTAVEKVNMTFAAGTYEVRYAETDNHSASAPKVITIAQGRVLNITLPEEAERIGYTISSSVATVGWREGAVITLELKPGYSKADNFMIKAVDGADSAVASTSETTLTLTDIEDDITVEVSGVVDKTAPTATIRITALSEKYCEFESFIEPEDITYKKAYKSTIGFDVLANDEGSGVKSIHYLKTDTPVSKAYLEEMAENKWSLFEDKFAIHDKFIVYVRVIDNDGNIAYFSSDGIVVYTDVATNNAQITYYREDAKDAEENVSVYIQNRNNTVKYIMVNEQKLLPDVDFEISSTDISFKPSALRKFPASETPYSFVVYYNPCGYEFVEGDEPNTVTIKAYIKKTDATLSDISDISKVYDGEDAAVPVYNTNSSGDVLVEYKLRDADDVEYTETKPVDVGDYTVRITIQENDNYNGISAEKDFSITKAYKDVPELTAVDETIKGKADGKMTGLTRDMEYRLDGEQEYTTVASAYMTFAPGTYYVRYADGKNFNVSSEVQVVIGEGRMLNITVPEALSQIGYEISSDVTEACWNDAVTFTYELGTGYTETDSFAIKVNGVKVEFENGEYVIEDAQTDIVVTVEGVRDMTVPTGSITVETNVWTSILNFITFNKFFKSTQDVKIAAQDDGSGMKSVKYYIADDALAEDEVKALDDESWSDYTEKFSIEPNTSVVVYARFEDNDANVSYVSSSGLVFYEDSLQDTREISFVKLSGEDKTAKVILNGNTIDNIKCNDYTLVYGTDYTVDDQTITFKAEYLQSLDADYSPYTFVISYKPLGHAYTPGDEKDAPLSTTVSVSVSRTQGVIKSISDISKTYDTNPVSAPSIEKNASDNIIVEYKLAGADDNTYTNVPPTDAGDYVVKVTALEDGNYYVTSISAEFSIYEKKIDAPVLDVVNETIAGKADGKINGLTTEMEWRKDSSNEYTAVTDAAMTFSRGTYHVRYAKKKNYIESDSVEVIIGVDKWLNVTVPENTEGYTVEITPNDVFYWHDDVTVKFTLADGYSCLPEFAVKVNGETVLLDGDNKYVITDIENDKVISVIGVEDNIAPEVEIVNDEMSYDAFDSEPSFGKALKGMQSFDISMSDAGSGIDTCKYYISSTAKSLEQIKAVSEEEWTVVNDGKVSIEAVGKRILYVKTVDRAGNVSYISTEGYVLYKDVDVLEKSAEFVRTSSDSFSIVPGFNGNTLSEIRQGDNVLVKNEDYVLENDTITFTNEYLKTLQAKDDAYVISISYIASAYDVDSNAEVDDTIINLKVSRDEGVIEILDDISKEYDSNAVQAPDYKAVVDSTVYVEYKKASENDDAYTQTAPVSAGEYVVRVRAEEGSCYTAAQMTKEFKIAPKKVNVQLVALNKVYDGNDNVSISGSIETGIDNETITVNGLAATFTDINVGEDVIIDVNKSNVQYFAGNGTTLSNYEIVCPDTTAASITKKDATVTADDKFIIYGYADPELTYSTTGVVEGDQLSINISRVEGTDVGSYEIIVTQPANANRNYNITFKNGILNIIKVTHNPPILTVVNETIKGKADGKILGLTQEMEIKAYGEQNYTPVSGSDMEFAAGKYYVRYAETNNYYASSDVEVNIQNGKMINIVLPEEQYGYAITCDKKEICWNEEVTFTFTVAEGYVASNYFCIRVNGEEITLGDDKKFVVTGNAEEINVTVDGIYDTVAPTGEITMSSNRWNTFLNKITFGLFFKSTQIVRINASDNESGIGKIEYVISDKQLSEEEVKAIDDWTEYKDSFDIAPSKAVVIYAKITDKAGNEIYISTSGIVVYKDVAQMMATAVYVKKSGLDKSVAITMNGNTVKSISNAGVELTEGTDYVVEANKIILKADYLQTLQAQSSSYFLEVTYNPFGKEYIEGESEGEQPATTIILLNINKASGKITDVSDISKVYDGKPVAQPTFTNNASNRLSILYKQRYAAEYTYTNVPPTEAGEYSVKISAQEDENYTATDVVKDFTISKVVQEAPGVTAVSETVKGKNDGTIAGLEIGMEIRKEGSDNYTTVTELGKNYEHGVYYVRYAGDSNHEISPDTKVVIEEGKAIAVRVPSEQEGFTLTTTAATLEWHGSATVEFALKDGYQMLENFAIMLNGEVVTLGEDNIYEITEAEGDYVFEVVGIADNLAPTGEISVSTSKWTSFLNSITFGFFFKDTQEVTITAQDAGSQVASIEYYVSERELSEDELNSLSDWTTYNGSFNIEPGKAYIIYAKFVDNAGNLTYIASDGIVVYTDAKQITKSVVFFTESSADKIVDVELNGNTVKSITEGINVLQAGNDYMVGNNKIAIRIGYLKTLQLRDAAYVLRIAYNPLGYEYDESTCGGDVPAVTTIIVTVERGHEPTPTPIPTATPTPIPTATPTPIPTATPTPEPTATPTSEPTATPTSEPTVTPTDDPVPPTDTPTVPPIDTPTVPPTDTPTVPPTGGPDDPPIYTPSTPPGGETEEPPIDTPTVPPIGDEDDRPTDKPTTTPKPTPTNKPVVNPTETPTALPTNSPVVSPTLPVIEATPIPKAEMEVNVLKLNEGLKVTQTGKNITVKWGRVSEATGYNVYVQYCGKKYSAEPTVVNNGSAKNKAKINKIGKASIKLNGNFKLYVEAFKLVDGKKITLGKTIEAHVVGKGNGKYTNAKNIIVKPKKVSLKVKKKAKIKAKTVLVEKRKKKLTNAHAKEFRFATSNNKIATVSPKGVIKAVGKGKCTVYVYSRNGLTKKIKVTVK